MKQRIIGILCAFIVFWVFNLIADASSMEGNITLSPDGMAFTTNAGDRNTKWYDKDYTVSTGVESTIREPQAGEHEYSREREKGVPIKEWKVEWPTGMCIHRLYPAGNQYHGVTFGKKLCEKPYYSGWFGYCADCGEAVNHSYFYMSESVAKSLKSLDLSKSYYYKCPHCDNLEQGVDLVVHKCKGISANRYYVRYHANFGKGSMEKSSHMVNNATEYEGRPVTPQTKLNLNTFSREGYEFAGWNTQKDGSGKMFKDGDTIYNLCMEENGSIILYAQWRKPSSTLEIDPNGGSYQGKSSIQKINGYYESEYVIEEEQLSSPVGNIVHFDTMGGESIPDMVSKMIFTGWSCCQPFEGKLEKGVYTFLGEDGTTDRIVANYQQDAIVLPEAKKTGQSFGGWYADPEGKVPIGQAGQLFQPNSEITVYATWVDLRLESKDNYTANQGKGAVDLQWEQVDCENKVYEVYQKSEGGLWKKVQDIEDNVENFDVYKSVFFTGREGVYTVPYTGFYTLQLYGAQGGNYGIYKGGRGACVEATLYLEKGEKLEYIIGGQNGFNGGGKAEKYGNGGGYSVVSSRTKGVIMLAAGGGGATNTAAGGPGGIRGQAVEGHQGESGSAGGGGGYYGGSAGETTIHKHSKECSHIHVGTPDIRGGCYTKPVSCGCKEIEFQKTHSGFFYGNIKEDGSRKFCDTCKSYECIGHLTEYGLYVCQRCGSTEKYPISQCMASTRYETECVEKYVCDMEDGQVLWLKTAQGGTNYVNQELCLNYQEIIGEQLGNGALIISSRQLGVQENHSLNGVEATDWAVPDAISPETIIKTAVNEAEIRIEFTRPKDNGTVYYHQVKSINKENMLQVSESNITKNVLISQVIGYRYLIDASSETEASEQHFFWEEKGEKPFIIVPVADEKKYLHIAAQDKAGNIGPTLHIPLWDQEVVYWPLITEKLLVKDEAYIASAQEPDTYYVRADNRSPVSLTLKGLLCGTARKDYQIDRADFVIQSMNDNSREGVLSVLVPKREKIYVGTYTYPMELLDKKHIGWGGVEDALFTQVQRYNLCRSLMIKQEVVLSDSMDGEKIRIMPRVSVTTEKGTNCSKEEEDLKNSIYLIGDAKGPQIKGEQQLKELEKVDINGKQQEIVLEAQDSGSGLQQFYVEIHNWDNNLTEYYEDTALTGKIKFRIEPKEPIFKGNFSIVVYAKDRVGNESSIHYGSLNVGIEAHVSRILEPHDPVFKRGESGLLHINTWGYVERIEILFPKDFTEQNPSLNQTIVYNVPAYVKAEEIPFIVPLSASEGSVTIQVKAYKEGTVYEAEPQLITLEIRGDIRDDLRTRLR